MGVPLFIKKAVSKNENLANFLKEKYDSFLEFFHEKSHVEEALVGQRISAVAQLVPLTAEGEIVSIDISQKKAVICLRDGTKFYLGSGRSITPWLLRDGNYEPEETTLAKRIIQKSWVVIDAGANFGWYSVHFSNYVGDGGRVFSFEPVPETYRELEENVKINDCKNITPINQALSDHAGTTNFFLPKTFRGSGLASEHNFFGEKVAVRLGTLDDFAVSHKLTKIDFIKADVEGGELHLLKGAGSVLEKYHPDLFIEIAKVCADRFGHSAKDVFGFLKGFGYEGFAILANGSFERISMDDNVDVASDDFYFTTSGIERMKDFKIK